MQSGIIYLIPFQTEDSKTKPQYLDLLGSQKKLENMSALEIFSQPKTELSQEQWW
jgi:hypothetical protein